MSEQKEILYCTVLLLRKGKKRGESQFETQMERSFFGLWNAVVSFESRGNIFKSKMLLVLFHFLGLFI